jgi:ferredoxin
VEELVERRVFGELTVEIDRTLCVGFGDCVEQGPELFELDDEGIVRFLPDATEVVRERLLLACDVCPVDALTVYEAGARIVPRRGS